VCGQAGIDAANHRRFVSTGAPFPTQGTSCKSEKIIYDLKKLDSATELNGKRVSGYGGGRAARIAAPEAPTTTSIEGRGQVWTSNVLTGSGVHKACLALDSRV
jgi:hypothetical protein